MRTLLTLFVSLALAVSASAQQRGAAAGAGLPPSVALPPELDRVLREYEAGWQAGDEAALAALFTPDGFVLRMGHPPVQGRAAVEDAYRGASGPLHLRALSFSTSGDTGYIVGGYAPEEGASDIGKFVLALRRGTDGRWLIAADIDNPNQRGMSGPP